MIPTAHTCIDYQRWYMLTIELHRYWLTFKILMKLNYLYSI